MSSSKKPQPDITMTDHFPAPNEAKYASLDEAWEKAAIPALVMMIEESPTLRALLMPKESAA